MFPAEVDRVVTIGWKQDSSIKPAVIWIFDADDHDYLIVSREELVRKIEHEAGVQKDVPLLILANSRNHTDTENMDSVRKRFFEKTPAALSDRSYAFIGTNIDTGEGLQYAFKWLREGYERPDWVVKTFDGHLLFNYEPVDEYNYFIETDQKHIAQGMKKFQTWHRLDGTPSPEKLEIERKGTLKGPKIFVPIQSFEMNMGKPWNIVGEGVEVVEDESLSRKGKNSLQGAELLVKGISDLARPCFERDLQVPDHFREDTLKPEYAKTQIDSVKCEGYFCLVKGVRPEEDVNGSYDLNDAVSGRHVAEM
ncbi:unnamed protein product [Fusarium equiseti]|uniref:Uncharacterized protein n=1 Tax=Fusarium equiseti TaxID=61235 RepID=A0A8J2IR90_FUSEQ|nr:unnamed protein product [Fusarium equiseti]